MRGLLRFRQSGGYRHRQVGKSFSAACRLPRGVDATQGEPGEIYVVDEGAICYQQRSTRIFQLVTDFALAVARIQQCRHGSGQGGGVVSSAELPTVGQEDGDDFAEFQTSGNESAS